MCSSASLNRWVLFGLEMLSTSESLRHPICGRQAVATSQPLAVQAGLRMLESGGNAVDAALAAAIALVVVEPTGCGLGGDAFALVWDGTRLQGFNGSGRSPQAWSLARFASRSAMPELGWDTVTTPGVVDAWRRLWHRFGRLPFEVLFKPAITWARQGFRVTPRIAGLWAGAAEQLRDFPEFQRTFLIDRRAPKAGERFRCPELAETLAEIAATGGHSFYTGDLAVRIAAAAAREGGALSADDLAAHQGQWVAPLSTAYRDCRVHELPPNGQGLAALLALGIIERFDLKRYGADLVENLHLQIEAMKIAFDVTARLVADPDFTDFDPNRVLEERFLDRCAARIYPDRAAVLPRAPSPEGGTVYLTTADAEGMMVSFIQSNYLGFGSGVVIPGTGIALHNRGRGFVLQKGHPNCVDGGKRPLHTIIPAFISRNGEPLMSFGVMGGRMQPQGHVQVVTRMLDHGQDPQTALDAARWYLDEANAVSVEPAFSQKLREALARRGHRIATDPATKIFGGGQVIICTDTGYQAASDPRKDGCASVLPPS